MAQEHLTDDIREAVEDQIAQLRAQLHTINRSLHDHGIGIEEFREDAKALADGATRNVQRAAHYVEDEAKAIAKVARRNPAGAGTALTLAAAIGFGIGYAVCQMQHESNSSHARWW